MILYQEIKRKKGSGLEKFYEQKLMNCKYLDNEYIKLINKYGNKWIYK